VKPPWSTKAFFCTFHKIEHDDVVSYLIFADECSDKDLWKWTTLALITIEEATKVYMVEVVLTMVPTH
jgi:hypothetical protein